jgi:hypothetical protein
MCRREAMQLFLKKSKGSITVFVTLILVPTIFFTSFMVDLARIKLYSNQAVMTADNYGQTVLTYYDNVLKELYGLFSVTQNETALKELETLQSYMATSFNPNSQQIKWKHMKETVEYAEEKLGTGSDYSGFMPYSSAAVEVNYTPVDNANLGTDEVLSSQIGDFMKFRIVQCIGDSGKGILEVLDSVQNLKGDAEAASKSAEIAEQAGELLDAAKEYYDELRKVPEYPDYIKGINEAISNFKTEYVNIINSDEYQAYVALMEIGEDVGKAASDEVSDYEDAMKNLKEGEEEPAKPSDDTYEKADIYDTWSDLCPDATEEGLKKSYDNAVKKITDKMAEGDITFDLFPSVMDSLAEKGGNNEKQGIVQTKYETIKALNDELTSILNDEAVTESVKKGIENSLNTIETIGEHVSTYRQMDGEIKQKNDPVNTAYKTQMDDFITKLNNYGAGAFIDGKADKDMKADDVSLLDDALLDESKYYDFTQNDTYESAYESLKTCFEKESNNDAEKYENMEDNAKNLLKSKQDALSDENESTDARDIPESFGYGSGGTGSGFNMTSMMKDASNMFSFNGIEQEGEKLLLKFYTVEYDFGMFSDRVTVEREKKKNETNESLTGYEMSKKINYLYGAELEYILNGANSSKDNLNAARNKILAFRAVMNFASTFLIDEVNNPINEISEEAAAINPILGLAVNGALRLAVAGAETYDDWDLLKSGDKAYVLKTKLDQMSAYGELQSLMSDVSDSVGGETEESAKKSDSSVSDTDSSGIKLAKDTDSITEDISKDTDSKKISLKKDIGIETTEETDSSGKSTLSIKMDYDNYLMIMMVFLTERGTVVQRTANLIELNVNTVEQKIGTDGTLSELTFKMDNAVTAVNATCSVHMDFLVMPDSFAQSVASDDTYSELKEFEKNSYKYTVTRGY